MRRYKIFVYLRIYVHGLISSVKSIVYTLWRSNPAYGKPFGTFNYVYIENVDEKHKCTLIMTLLHSHKKKVIALGFLIYCQIYVKITKMF